MTVAPGTESSTMQFGRHVGSVTAAELNQAWRWPSERWGNCASHLLHGLIPGSTGGMPMAKEPTAAKHPLIGAAAHSLDENRTTLWQVEILDVFPSGSPDVGDLALVQYYEWLTGYPSTRGLIPLREMATRNWKLFPNMESATAYYKEVASPRDARIRERAAKQKGGGQ